MTTLSNNLSPSLMQPNEWQPVTPIPESHENSADIQSQTTSWQLVPYAKPMPISLIGNQMIIYTLNTPQSIYEMTVTHFPSARLEAHVQHTNEVAIKILLGSDIPEIHLKGSVFKEAFETRLLIIRASQALNLPLQPSISDCDWFLTNQPLTEWKQFNRIAHERKGGSYTYLIADYLNHPTEYAEKKLLDLGLTPSQVCKEGYLLPEEDLNYFRRTLDKDLKLCVKMKTQYPGVLEQIQDKDIEEDLQNKSPSHHDKTPEILRTGVVGQEQEMASSGVAPALSSKQNGRKKNYSFLFVRPTATEFFVTTTSIAISILLSTPLAIATSAPLGLIIGSGATIGLILAVAIITYRRFSSRNDISKDKAEEKPSPAK